MGVAAPPIQSDSNLNGMETAPISAAFDANRLLNADKRDKDKDKNKDCRSRPAS